MIEYLKNILSSSGDKSSSRLINFIGAIAGTVLLAYETYLHGLHADVFGVYLAYCGFTYTGGKYLDKKGTDNETIS